MKIFLFLFLVTAPLFSAQLEKHLKPIEVRTQGAKIEPIDCIYLINLDQRKDRLATSLSQLAVFGIVPCRFPAIYGWKIPPETLNEIGLQFLPDMQGDEWASYYPSHEKGSKFEFLTPDCYGRTFFSLWITTGAIGCSLSHLSVLQDAWDSGFETIWVLEDDFVLKGNPHLLSIHISKLDQLAPDWDLLYTDMDTENAPFYDAPNDFETDLKGHLLYYWRPDMKLKDDLPLRKRTIISPDFLKIGGRMRTTSIIIRRSGMKKILQQLKSHGIFAPYDHELSLIPNIQLYNLRYSLITFMPSRSDIAEENYP